MTENNLYAVLGLLPTADDKVVKAAYRVLSSIYHPDKNDSPAANFKMQEINLAYEILGDPLKRKKYDDQHDLDYNEASSPDSDSEFSFCNDELANAWDVIINIYPDIQNIFIDLESLSSSLAFGFRVKMIEERDFKNFKEIAERAKHEYLSKYFGNNSLVIKYAEKLIKLKERDAALYLNRIVTVMGVDVDFKLIEEAILDKFPKIELKARGADLYKKIILDSGYPIYSATRLIGYEGGEVSFSLIGDKVTLKIKNEEKTFRNKEEFVDYVRDRYRDIFS